MLHLILQHPVLSDLGWGQAATRMRTNSKNALRLDLLLEHLLTIFFNDLTAAAFTAPLHRAMHNKPYNVDASKIKRVLPDFEYIPLEASVQSAADSIVGMGLAAFYDSSSRSCWGLWPAGGLCGRRPAAAAPAAVGPANDAAAAAQAPALAAVKASLSAPTCPQISIGNDDEQQQQQQQQKVRLAEVLATTESTGPPDVSSGVLALIVSPRVPEPKGTATHQAEAEQQV